MSTTSSPETPRVLWQSRGVAEPCLPVDELQTHLRSFARSYRSAHLPPLAPPHDPSNLKRDISLWLFLACTAVPCPTVFSAPTSSSTGDATPLSGPPSKKRKIEDAPASEDLEKKEGRSFEQEASAKCQHSSWASHIRCEMKELYSSTLGTVAAAVEPDWSESLLHEISRNSNSELRLDWRHVQMFLSVVLIRRLCERFQSHVLTLLLTEDSSLSTSSESAPLSEPDSWQEQYSRDCEYFLAQRRFLVLLLRAYPFAPFTLPRLAELLRKKSTPATWGHSFGKWCYAVARTLRGVFSELPVAPQVTYVEPEALEILLEIKQCAYVKDTVPCKKDFVAFETEVNNKFDDAESTSSHNQQDDVAGDTVLSATPAEPGCIFQTPTH